MSRVKLFQRKLPDTAVVCGCRWTVSWFILSASRLGHVPAAPIDTLSALTCAHHNVPLSIIGNVEYMYPVAGLVKVKCTCGSLKKPGAAVNALLCCQLMPHPLSARQVHAWTMLLHLIVLLQLLSCGDLACTRRLLSTHEGKQEQEGEIL